MDFFSYDQTNDIVMSVRYDRFDYQFHFANSIPITVDNFETDGINPNGNLIFDPDIIHNDKLQIFFI